MRLVKVAAGIHWVDIPEANLRILCGCPADSVKHLMKRGLVIKTEVGGSVCETGPNAILLSDVALQNGEFSNLSEFPILQMFYRQGMILPGHPNNTGAKPLLIGLEEQVRAQLSYIHRGNYGLISESELVAAGVPPAQAREWMRMKRRFAFGEIKESDDLIDCCIVGRGPVEVKPGLSIRRLDLNVFEIRHGEDRVVVDLNLAADQTYEPPFPLSFHNLRREYFAVVHSGEGDGWDVNRPTMSSVLMFQGKIFLVDAGPNLQAVLKALGISINEIEGLFHTHSHDDHFCGLTTLIRADRRIRYYATAAVRAAVTKKLAALMSIDEQAFAEYFEIHDLEIDQWTDVEGLAVKPMFSPHPVETTIFTFRALSDSGPITYAHYADIISFKVLKQMTTLDPFAPGIAPEAADKVRRDYLEPANLKKIDVGGGLIHGSAEDFTKDKSRKIILAHTAKDLSNAQRRIGSGAPFGTVDVLIPAVRDYALGRALAYLTTYFPQVPQYDLEMLLNRPIFDINAETIVLRQGERCDVVTMPLTGLMEVVNNDGESRYHLSSGMLIGESACLEDVSAAKTYRAASFVKAISWPAEIYRDFIRRNNLMESALATTMMRSVFARTGLFGENVSIPVMNRLVRMASLRSVGPGEEVLEDGDCLLLIRVGVLERRAGESVGEVLVAGDFFGEAMVLCGLPSPGKIVAHKACELIAIPGSLLREIPIVRWKLFETHLRRERLSFVSPGEKLPFPWSANYALGVPSIDRQHQRLFDIANQVIRAIDLGLDSEMRSLIVELLEYNNYHLIEELKFMERVSFLDIELHGRIKKKNKSDILEINALLEKSREDEFVISRSDFVDLFRSWIFGHILKEDRNFVQYLHGECAK
jgi:hemerythrin